MASPEFTLRTRFAVPLKSGRTVFVSEGVVAYQIPCMMLRLARVDPDPEYVCPPSLKLRRAIFLPPHGKKIGAGGRNRTDETCLEGRSFATKLRPHWRRSGSFSAFPRASSAQDDMVRRRGGYRDRQRAQPSARRRSTLQHERGVSRAPRPQEGPWLAHREPRPPARTV